MKYLTESTSKGEKRNTAYNLSAEVKMRHILSSNFRPKLNY